MAHGPEPVILLLGGIEAVGLGAHYPVITQIDVEPGIHHPVAAHVGGPLHGKVRRRKPDPAVIGIAVEIGVLPAQALVGLGVEGVQAHRPLQGRDDRTVGGRPRRGGAPVSRRLLVADFRKFHRHAEGVLGVAAVEAHGPGDIRRGRAPVEIQGHVGHRGAVDLGEVMTDHPLAVPEDQPQKEGEGNGAGPAEGQ